MVDFVLYSTCSSDFFVIKGQMVFTSDLLVEYSYGKFSEFGYVSCCYL